AEQRVVAARTSWAASVPGARLDHHELSWRAGGGDRRRGKGEHVVVGRERAVGDHVGRDVDRHRGQYTLVLGPWDLGVGTWDLGLGTWSGPDQVPSPKD